MCVCLCVNQLPAQPSDNFDKRQLMESEGIKGVGLLHAHTHSSCTCTSTPMFILSPEPSLKVPPLPSYMQDVASDAPPPYNETYCPSKP